MKNSFSIPMRICDYGTSGFNEEFRVAKSFKRRFPSPTSSDTHYAAFLSLCLYNDVYVLIWFYRLIGADHYPQKCINL